MYEADRFAKKAGVPQEVMERVITELDKQQDDEPTRTNWEEWIFHPTPSADNRIVELNRKRARGPFGAWHASALALYTSGRLRLPVSRGTCHCRASDAVDDVSGR
ncbi:MAG: hypothetical protein U0694_22160 [Anaerolineae bacterium]